jgi:uncharacterized protein (DUF2062 family)
MSSQFITRIKNKMHELALQERSSKKLALSCAMGVFIAFSPFICFHTVMTFVLTWLMGLNLAATFAVSVLVNNPWTMLPIYSADYFFGEFLLHDLLGIDTVSMNPAWMCWINEKLAYYCGIKDVSFWAFMIGGNVLGALITITLYPLFKRLFDRIMHSSRTSYQARGR